MNRQIAGWIIISMCLLWGALRTIDLVEPNFVLNFFSIGGFCFVVYLTKDLTKEES